MTTGTPQTVTVGPELQRGILVKTQPTALCSYSKKQQDWVWAMQFDNTSEQTKQ